MFCTHCGSRVPEAASFCVGCGVRVASAPAASEAYVPLRVPPVFGEVVAQETPAEAPSAQTFERDSDVAIRAAQAILSATQFRAWRRAPNDDASQKRTRRLNYHEGRS